MQKIYRQGDVLFRAVEKVSENAKPSEDRILVRGETTGHAHRASKQLLVFKEPETQKMFVSGSGQILHEEHDTLELERGNYEVIRQREYNPSANRFVQD
jgi:hypothetical protein